MGWQSELMGARGQNGRPARESRKTTWAGMPFVNDISGDEKSASHG